MRYLMPVLFLVACGELPRPTTHERVTREAVDDTEAVSVADDEAAVAEAQNGGALPSTKPRTTEACAVIGTQSIASCVIPFALTASSTMPAPTADNTFVEATGYGGEGSMCADMHSFVIAEGEEGWTKIWAVPAQAPKTVCDCENTEVVLRVRGSRTDNNVWCAYSCASNYASCSRNTYCAGNCPPDTLCGFQSLPSLSFHQAEVRVRGRWTSVGNGGGFCSFKDARIYRDMVGPDGVNLFAGVVAASAVDLRTGETKGVRTGYRSHPADGHEPAPKKGCCGGQ